MCSRVVVYQDAIKMHAWDVNSENITVYIIKKHYRFRAFTILVARGVFMSIIQSILSRFQT